MSKGIFSFYDYVYNYTTINTITFKEIFNDRLRDLNQNILSSKRLMEDLRINGNYEYTLFRSTYLDYFRLRMNMN
jgi:hypothetical protein